MIHKDAIRARQKLVERLPLTGEILRLTLATDQPGVQVYDGQFNTPAYNAIAIEAQGWPDAPNHSAFPGIALNPGQTYRQTTTWRFDPL